MLNTSFYAQGLAAFGWLGLVLLLIVAASRLMRHLPAFRQNSQGSGKLTIIGSLALDPRRRIFLVEASGREALVLTGGVTDVILSLPGSQC